MSNEGAPQFYLIDTASVLLNSTIQLEGANPLRTLNRRGYRDSYIPKHGCAVFTSRQQEHAKTKLDIV